MMKSSLCRAAIAFLGLFAAVAFAETVEKKYDDGTVKLKYEVDAKGKKDGLLEEFYPTGKAKLRAEYKGDLLDGKYASFFEDGRVRVTATYQKGKLNGVYTERTDKGQLRLMAHYKDGKLDGNVTRYEEGLPAFTLSFQNGEPVFARSAKEIRDTLKEIVGPPRKGKDMATERDAALRRLKAYRYLAGVPYEELELEEDYNRLAQAAAKLCEKLKRLDHNPPNAGLPAKDYKLAKAGAASCNLGYGFARLADSVDYYIGDIHSEWLGHRRWTLYPYLAKTGFGRAGMYSGMHATDRSLKDVPDFDFVSWPPPGYVPVTMFQPGISWSVSLNPAKFKALADGAQARVFQSQRAIEQGRRTAEVELSQAQQHGRRPAALRHFSPGKNRHCRRQTLPGRRSPD